VGSALDVEVLAVQSIWPLAVAGSRSPPWLVGTSAWDPFLGDEESERPPTRFPGSQYAAMALASRLAERLRE